MTTSFFNGPTLVCRCGRVFFDGEDPWPHVREEYEQEQQVKLTQKEMMRLMNQIPMGTA